MWTIWNEDNLDEEKNLDKENLDEENFEYWELGSFFIQVASGDKNKAPVLEHSTRAKNSPIF